MLGHKHSLEAIEKIQIKAEAKQLSGNVTIVINKKDNTIKTFPSVRNAARYLKTFHQSLEYCMDNNVLFKNTFLIIKFIKIK